MFRWQGGTSQGRLQGSDLLVQQQSSPLTDLMGSQRIIYFTANVEQYLLKVESYFSLLCTGDMVLSHHLLFIKERLRERAHHQYQEPARIKNRRLDRARPSGTPARHDGRVESRTCRIGAIERCLQHPLDRADIGAGGKHPDRDPYGKARKRLSVCQRSAFVVARRLCQQ